MKLPWNVARRAARHGRLLSVNLLLAALLVCISACSESRSHLPLVDLSFRMPDGKTTPAFRMEVASTTPDRTKGLMYRKELPSDKGMIFVFPEEKVHSFWMRNTYIPLDMVFVSKEMKVVGIIENVPPLTEVARSVGVPSTYVLEFASGTMRNHGVVNGAIIQIKGRLPAPL